MQRIRKLRFLAAAALLAAVGCAFALALPALASADSKAVIKDCAEDGSIDGTYTKSELEKARKQLPSDLDEYTDCRDSISDAIAGTGRKKSDDAATTASTGVGGGGLGGGGVTPSGGVPGQTTPADEAALEQQQQSAEKGGAPSIPVGGENVKPATGPFAPADAINQLPLPVLLGLISVLMLGSWAGLVALRRRLSPEVLAKLPAFMRGDGGGFGQMRDRLSGLSRGAFGRFRS